METNRNPESPEMPYRHIWTDENGVTRQDRCRMSNFAFANISEGAAPSRIGRPGDPAAASSSSSCPTSRGAGVTDRGRWATGLRC